MIRPADKVGLFERCIVAIRGEIPERDESSNIRFIGLADYGFV